jgi:hypothetical protein
MLSPVFELTTDHIVDLAQASNHDGRCQCWRCLHWWAVMSKPYYRESLSPFDEEVVQSYLAEGFKALIHDEHFSAVVTVLHGHVTTEAPTIKALLTSLGSDRFATLEEYAHAQHWVIEHPYTQVYHRYAKLD